MHTSPQQPLLLPAGLSIFRDWEFPHKLGLCDYLFGRTLSPHGTCWVRTAPGPVWKLDLSNQTHRWIVYGYYEGPDFWRWLRRQNGIRTIVDSGANIGQTALYFCALLPNARILAYEPGIAARTWLIDSVDANRFAQIVVESAGLGSSMSTAKLAADGSSDRHGSWNKVSSTVGEPINIVTLDSELARHGIEILDLWKLDMEGYELQALHGATQALSSGRIRAIYIEAAGEAGRAALAFLTSHRYRVHGISSSGQLTPYHQNHPYDNVLCLAPGQPANRL